MTSTIATCYGVTLIVFGFIHLAFGKIVYDSFIFMYGFLFGHCPIMLIFALLSRMQIFNMQAASFILAHAAMASAVTLGVASCKWKRIAAGSIAGLAGLAVWLLDFALTRKPMDVGSLMVCMSFPFLSATIYPNSFIVLSTACVGFAFFVNGLCILLEEPFHRLVIDKIVNGPEGVFVSPAVRFCINESLILAALCILFQFFCLRRTHHSQQNDDDLESSGKCQKN